MPDKVLSFFFVCLVLFCFVLVCWYLLLEDTDDIFFSHHLEHISNYLLLLVLFADQQSLGRDLCHIPGPSALRTALLQWPVQQSCWKLQFPIMQLPKPQLRNNFSFDSVITQLHWPYHQLLVCQKPSTFMWYFNQLNLQLSSRLQICSQRQQLYHGCKSTLFIYLFLYYNIVSIIIIIRESTTEPKSACPISRRDCTLSLKNPFALSDSNSRNNGA